MYGTDEMNQYSAQAGGSNEGLPDEQLIKKELLDIIKLLPHPYEKPIQLFLTGYSYKEISQYMNIPIGTVKSRIHLGKKHSRKVYMALLNDLITKDHRRLQASNASLFHPISHCNPRDL